MRKDGCDGAGACNEVNARRSMTVAAGPGTERTDDFGVGNFYVGQMSHVVASIAGFMPPTWTNRVSDGFRATRGDVSIVSVPNAQAPKGVTDPSRQKRGRDVFQLFRATMKN